VIGLHCDTCDGSLVLTARVTDGTLVVTRHPYSECQCMYTDEELLNILDDAYESEM